MNPFDPGRSARGPNQSARARVLRGVVQMETWTLTELAEEADVSRATVSRVCQDAHAQGLVSITQRATGGRPKNEYSLTQSGRKAALEAVMKTKTGLAQVFAHDVAQMRDGEPQDYIHEMLDQAEEKLRSAWGIEKFPEHGLKQPDVSPSSVATVVNSLE